MRTKEKIDSLQEKIRRARISYEVHQQDLERSIKDLKNMGIDIDQGDRMLSTIEKEIRMLDKKEARLIAKLEREVLRIERNFNG